MVSLVAAARKGGRVPKLLTLTQTDRAGETWRDAYRRLRRALGRLRRSASWRSYVQASLAVVETTWGRCAWHVHVHILLDSEYWPQHEISGAWFLATDGESYVVDIRAADRGSGRELGKYALKVAVVPKHQIVEYVRGAKGVRLVSASGRWYGVLADADLEGDTDATESMVYCPLPLLIESASRGDATAVAALAAIEAWLQVRALKWRGRSRPTG